jgi:hypothetical protein
MVHTEAKGRALGALEERSMCGGAALASAMVTRSQIVTTFALADKKVGEF